MFVDFKDVAVHQSPGIGLVVIESHHQHKCKVSWLRPDLLSIYVRGELNKTTRPSLIDECSSSHREGLLSKQTILSAVLP